MLTHHRKSVSLSFMSLDMPLLTTVETAATIYAKEPDRFHLLLTEPLVQDPFSLSPVEEQPSDLLMPRLLWMELSPYRIIMTMQGNGKFSYRHFWEQGVYGLSRYWLQGDNLGVSDQIRLRNYTRSLILTRDPLPKNLRIEYELWTNQIRMGLYVLNLEIQH